MQQIDTSKSHNRTALDTSRLMELDYISNINCYSEVHASCQAVIRQLPKVTVTIKDIGKTEQ